MIRKSQRAIRADLTPKPRLVPEAESLSQSSDVLWNYMKNSQRSEPVIGLSALVECHTDDRPPYYVCEACSIKTRQSCIVDHIISCGHRFQYMKSHHPNHLCDWKENPDLVTRVSALREMASQLEKEEGFEDAQVLELDGTEYKYMVSGTIDEALKKIKICCKKRNERDLRHLVTPTPTLVTIKQEAVESCLTPPRPILYLKSTGMAKVGTAEIPTREYKVLWNYLNSKLRRQPVVGLRTIVEYHMDNQAPYIRCETCAQRLPPGFNIGHLISTEHRYMYIKLKHPELLRGWKENPDLTELQDALMEKSKFLEQMEGLGEIKVMKMVEGCLEEVVLPPTDKVIVKQEVVQGLFPKKTHTQDPIRTKKIKIKEELMECVVTTQLPVLESDQLEAEAGRVPTGQGTCEHTTTDTKAKTCSVPEGAVAVTPPTSVPLLSPRPETSRAPAQNLTDTKAKQTVWKHSAPQKSSMEPIFAAKYRNLRIVGLRALIGCHAHNRLLLFFCKACMVRVSRRKIFKHVNSKMHQIRYITAGSQHLLAGSNMAALFNDPKLCCQTTEKLVKMEGPGDIQVLELDTPTYTQVSTMPVKAALDTLQNICMNRMDLQYDVTPSSAVAIFQKKVKHRLKAPQVPTQGPNTEIQKAVKEKQAVIRTPEAPAAVRTPEALVKGSKEPATEDPASPTAPLKPMQVSRSTETNQEITLDTATKNMEAGLRQGIQQAPLLDPIFLQMNRGTAVDESHLAKFMFPFLTGRAQPIIGLKALVECRSFKLPTFYLCLTCSVKMGKIGICNHIIDRRHQYFYVKSLHPYLLDDWGENPDLTKRAMSLMDIAQAVENQEGKGEVQVMKLDPLQYQEVASASFDIALEKLQMIRKEHNQKVLWTPLTPGLRFVQAPSGPAQARPVQAKAPPAPTKAPPLPTEAPILLAHAPPICIQVQPLPNQTPLNTETNKSTVVEQAGQGTEASPVSGHVEPGDGATLRALQKHLLSLTDTTVRLPIVGLKAVIECHNVEGKSCPYYYLCQACSVKMEEDFIVEHLTSSLHQYHYFNSHRCEMLEEEKKKTSTSLLGISEVLLLAAMRLKEEEGSGSLQLMELPECAYKKLAEGSYEVCMKVIKRARGTEEEKNDSTERERFSSLPLTVSNLAWAPKRFAPGSDDDHRGAIAQVLSIKSDAVFMETAVVPYNSTPKILNVVERLRPKQSNPAGPVTPVLCPCRPPSPLVSLTPTSSDPDPGDCSAIIPVKAKLDYSDRSSTSLVKSKPDNDDYSSSKLSTLAKLSTSQGESIECWPGLPTEMTLSSCSLAENRQKISDLIVELIVLKELEQLQHSRTPSKLDALRITGPREASRAKGEPITPGELGASLHKLSAQKRKRLEDEKDLFSYENRQFVDNLNHPSCTQTDGSSNSTVLYVRPHPDWQAKPDQIQAFRAAPEPPLYKRPNRANITFDALSTILPSYVSLEKDWKAPSNSIQGKAAYNLKCPGLSEGPGKLKTSEVNYSRASWPLTSPAVLNTACSGNLQSLVGLGRYGRKRPIQSLEGECLHSGRSSRILLESSCHLEKRDESKDTLQG